MPINKEAWDSGKVHSLEERIMSFLNKGNEENQAFSLQEIMKGLGYKVKKDIMVHEPNVKNTVDNLVKEGKVEKKTIKELIGEETYYRITPTTDIRIGWLNEKPKSNEK